MYSNKNTYAITDNSVFMNIKNKIYDNSNNQSCSNQFNNQNDSPFQNNINNKVETLNNSFIYESSYPPSIQKIGFFNLLQKIKNNRSKKKINEQQQEEEEEKR